MTQKVYTVRDHEIVASVGEPFTIELESNPTTGYQWDLEFDAELVRVLDRKVEPRATAFGAGGTERFVVEPMRVGETAIRARYRRVWEAAPVETQEFEVHVR